MRTIEIEVWGRGLADTLFSSVRDAVVVFLGTLGFVFWLDGQNLPLRDAVLMAVLTASVISAAVFIFSLALGYYEYWTNRWTVAINPETVSWFKHEPVPLENCRWFLGSMGHDPLVRSTPFQFRRRAAVICYPPFFCSDRITIPLDSEPELIDFLTVNCGPRLPDRLKNEYRISFWITGNCMLLFTAFSILAEQLARASGGSILALVLTGMFCGWFYGLVRSSTILEDFLSPEEGQGYQFTSGKIVMLALLKEIVANSSNWQVVLIALVLGGLQIAAVYLAVAQNSRIGFAEQPLETEIPEVVEPDSVS